MPRNTYKNCKKNKSKSKSHSNKILCPLINVNNFLRLKYSSDPYTYSYQCIKNLIFNEKCRIVSRFKDYLVLDDNIEFLNKFYYKNEQKKRLNKILEFYDKYNKVFPNYMILPENEYIYKNLRKKQKMIDIQNEKLLSQEKKNKKGLHLDDASVYSIFFTKKINASIDKKKDSISSIKIIENNKLNDYINNESFFNNSKKSLNISRFSKGEIFFNDTNIMNITPTSSNMIIKSNNNDPTTFRSESSIMSVVSLLNNNKNEKNNLKNNEVCCTPKKAKKNSIKVLHVPQKSLNNNKQFFCHKKNISDIYGIKNAKTKKLFRSKFMNQNKICFIEPSTPVKNFSKFKFQKSFKKNSNKKAQKQYFNENERNSNKENEMIRSNLFFQLIKKNEKFSKIIINKNENNLITISNRISSNLNTININSTNSNTNTFINLNQKNEYQIYDYNGNYNNKNKLNNSNSKEVHNMKNQKICNDKSLEKRERNEINNDTNKKKVNVSNRKNNRYNENTKVLLTQKLFPIKEKNLLNLNNFRSRQLTNNDLERYKTQNENMDPNINNVNGVNVALSSNIKMNNNNLIKAKQLFSNKKIEIIKQKFSQNQKKKSLKKFKTDPVQINFNKCLTKIDTNNNHNIKYNTNNFKIIQIHNLQNSKKNSASIGGDKNKNIRANGLKNNYNKKLQYRNNIIINNHIKDFASKNEHVFKYHKSINDNPNLHLSYVPYTCNTHYRNNTIENHCVKEIYEQPKFIKINCVNNKNNNFKSPIHKRFNTGINVILQTPSKINSVSSTIIKNMNFKKKFVFIQNIEKNITNSVKSNNNSNIRKFMRNNFILK